MRSTITHFKRQSVLVLIGLTFITAQNYLTFWLRRQSRILNQDHPQQAIPAWFFPLLVALSIFSIGCALPEVLTDNALGFITVGELLSKADLIFTIIWVFKVRNRLNALLETSKKDKTWFGILWTSLVGIIYLQFKLNQLQMQQNHVT
jgi:hypothetical protein